MAGEAVASRGFHLFRYLDERLFAYNFGARRLGTL